MAAAAIAMAPHTSSHSSSWHLSSIHVKAFKSFSRAASFQIGSGGLVGIVGPNGSGKSNLLEAIIFATGCNTALLRGCKVLRDVSSTDTGSQVCNMSARNQHAAMLHASIHAQQATIAAGLLLTACPAACRRKTRFGIQWAAQ